MYNLPFIFIEGNIFLIEEEMAIIKNCEIHFAKLNPNRPNSNFNKLNPTWEVQIRTSNKETKAEWEKAGLRVKAMIPDQGEPYYRVNLKRKSRKEEKQADGSVKYTPNAPVKVVDGKMNPIDPDTIGNGSIANVRIFQREYKDKNGKPAVASTLMGLQLTKHIIYVPKKRDDDFEETDTETVAPELEDEEVL